MQNKVVGMVFVLTIFTLCLMVKQINAGDISIECTQKCIKYWECRLKGLFIFGDCDDSGCDCSKFAWQSKRYLDAYANVRSNKRYFHQDKE
ncbi:unnamed protein product [Didymodactylos carnosus]|uniref:Uncharacterized protein n=1 Tax=Didymodactylos carnosus TaxID=1234261 RepID=A0A814V9I8_9BILA|nr:unnamed protein product [Didymodactylos carnosus]CAF1188060.1 unnamed protein product [Didymodactylos carnosus]CAF3752082.1 unnamed protein product [Didymodactylos carnosus]CAF3952320.1 unnamed protein product [Didymodactylos carnosus]